jgi:hypothetical protein
LFGVFLHQKFKKLDSFSPSGVNVPMHLGPFKEIATITGHCKKCVWLSVAFGGTTFKLLLGYQRLD